MADAFRFFGNYYHVSLRSVSPDVFTHIIQYLYADEISLFGGANVWTLTAIGGHSELQHIYDDYWSFVSIDFDLRYRQELWDDDDVGWTHHEMCSCALCDD